MIFSTELGILFVAELNLFTKKNTDKETEYGSANDASMLHI